MQLSDRERRVLLAIELDSEKPLAQIRRETGLRDHSIRYCIDRLEQRGIIFKRTFINIYALGYVEYAIYFSISSAQAHEIERCIKALQNYPEVSWLVSLGGDYQYGVAICARHHSAVLDFIDRVSKSYPNIFFDKALSIRSSLTIFPRKIFGARKTPMKPLGFGPTPSPQTIDDKDRDILSGLERAKHRSHRELARELSVPIATLEHRISKLKRSGVICGQLYRINTAAAGFQVYRILVYTRAASAAWREKLYRFAEQHRAINYYIECLGNWDHELGVEVERAEEAISLTQELASTFSDQIRSFKILPVFQQHKVANFPF